MCEISCQILSMVYDASVAWQLYILGQWDTHIWENIGQPAKPSRRMVDTSSYKLLERRECVWLLLSVRYISVDENAVKISAH